MRHIAFDARAAYSRPSVLEGRKVGCSSVVKRGTSSRKTGTTCAGTSHRQSSYGLTRRMKGESRPLRLQSSTSSSACKLASTASLDESARFNASARALNALSQ